MQQIINYYPEAQNAGPSFDEWVEQLNTKKNGELYFVEIGAMDGMRHDALYKHIIAHNQWSGLLVEPLPDMFEKLKETYTGRDNLSFEPVAITEASGTAEITRIPAEKVDVDVPGWADGISTLKPDQHIISKDASLAAHTVKQQIQTMTFADLAQKYNITQIDLFQSDTEGYDETVFNQLWALGFRPSIIKFEINYMIYNTIRNLRWMLEQSGYTCFYQDDDMVAVKL